MTQPPRRIRASDDEREEYAKMLRAAMTEGRLSLADGEERLAKVYAATFRDELDPLTVDLPDGGRRALFDTPEFREQARRHLRRHAGRVGSIAAVLVGIWVLVALLTHPHFFWPIIPIVIMTLGLLRHRAWYRYGGYRRGGPWQGHGPWHGHGHGQGQGHAHGKGRGQWRGDRPWRGDSWGEGGWRSPWRDADSPAA